MFGCAAGAITFFFFQAEDGIRDWSVTGVQTCALPISVPLDHRFQVVAPWQYAKRMSPFAAQARGAEELSRLGIAEAQHERGLKGDGHPLDESARSELEVFGIDRKSVVVGKEQRVRRVA